MLSNDTILAAVLTDDEGHIFRAKLSRENAKLIARFRRADF